MSNSANIRLVVIGKHTDVAAFSKSVPIRRPSRIFAEYMLEGEGGPLSADRLDRVSPSISRKVYCFQLRNDYGQQHFRRVSRTHPNLRFILVYFDPNCDERGSYLIRAGRVRTFRLESGPWEALLQKHGYVDDDGDDSPFWEASWEAMDICQARWETLISPSV